MTNLSLKYALESEHTYLDINEEEYDRRMFLQRCEDIIKRGAIKGKNKGCLLLREQQIILEEYFQELLVNGKIKSYKTVESNITSIFRFGIEVKKPFSLITENEIKGYILKLKQRTVSYNSIGMRLAIIKRFFKWLRNKGECNILMDWFKFKPQKTEILENELPGNEDIKKMAMTGDKREGAFLLIVYEGALRLNEALAIKLKDISWNTDGSVNIVVNGKTGKRRLLFIDSVPYIKEWLKEHPFRDNPNSALFINKMQFGRQLKQFGGYCIIKKLAKRANIKINLYPHLLRHARLNYLAKYYKFNERDLRKFAGWTGSSDMPNIYLHYDMDAVDDKIKGVKGLTENTLDNQRLEQEKILKNIKCDKCGYLNSSTSIVCDNCNEFFEIVKREQADKELNELFEDKEFQDLVKNFLRKKELGGIKNEK